MAAAGEESQPSKSNPRPLAAARHRGTISKVGPCGGAYFQVLHICHISMHFIFKFLIFFLHIQRHELKYTGKGEGALHILRHTSFGQNFTFFRRVTCDEPPSRIGTRKASDCPINVLALTTKSPLTHNHVPMHQTSSSATGPSKKASESGPQVVWPQKIYYLVQTCLHSAICPL